MLTLATAENSFSLRIQKSKMQNPVGVDSGSVVTSVINRYQRSADDWSPAVMIAQF